MKIAFVMLDAMIGKRAHRGGGAIYALLSYLQEKNEYISQIQTKVFNFNSVYTGPVNLYISAILDYEPDIVAFSTYCWNIELVKVMSKCIKNMNSNIKVVLGGPEVSYNSQELLEEFRDLDVIIRGEGEVTFNELMTYFYLGKSDLSQVQGITYRDQDNRIIFTEERPLHPCLDDFPSPFLKGTINFAQSDGEVAYESVRGCKFRCSYCLHTKGLSFVREYSLDRVEEELKLILQSDSIKIIWFLDPTFNADEKRALEVLKIIEKYNPNMPLAFEIRADLLTDALIEQFGKLNVAEVGIGLQSYSEDVNKHVHRKNNIDCVEDKLFKLKEAIADHCEQFDIDLIYGLPGDVYDNYKKSVNYILYLNGRIYYQPLRIFKGTQLHKDLDKYGVKYNSTAPYNILSNNSYTLDQMVSSYCLNVGIDYINRNGIYREIIDLIKKSKNIEYSDILEMIGRYFWSIQRYDIFRISNWSPDDRDDQMVFEDFCKFLDNYLNEDCQSLVNAIRLKIDSYVPIEKADENSTYSQYGYFQLTI